MRKTVLWMTVGVFFLLVLGIVESGCSKKGDAPKETTKTEQPSLPPPSPPPPPPPPPPPDTSLGSLFKVERLSATEIQVLCTNPRGMSFITSGPIDPTAGEKGQLKAKLGQEVFTSGVETMCGGTERETAGKGKQIVVLHFEGKARRSQTQGVVKWVVAPQSHFLTRADEKSWLTDSVGTRYKNPFFLSTKQKRQLSIIVPADAVGLVWHDGKKKAYQLEPTIAEVTTPALAAAIAPQGKE